MEFFYLEKTGEKRGPVNSAQLRALAANGILTPETVIIAGGRNLPARKVKGLEFAVPVPPVVSEPEPEPYPIADPLPAPEPTPAPTPSTVFTSGGTYVDTSVSATAPEPSGKIASRKQKARDNLEWWVTSLTAIAGFEIILGIIGGVFCIIRGVEDGADALIGTGVGAIIGGFASAILPLALASIGRFLLTHIEPDKGEK